MNKNFTVFFLVLITIFFLSSASAFASFGITGSHHDFSGQTSWNTTGEICVVCHTPHNATDTIIPLWNHTTTAATFTTYSSSTLNAAVAQPGASSKACLSCHDGTVAYDSFGGRSGSEVLPPWALIGTDLSNDHPVSFAYDAALATNDGSLYNPTTQTVDSLHGMTIDAGMLINHKLECASCHDIHHAKGDSMVTYDSLIVYNGKSTLCLTCHKK